jgi:hypothetical protein
MRRLQFSIWPGNATRLDGRKSKTSCVVRGNTPVARKALIDRFRLRIIRMSVFALRIRLPHFDDPIGHRMALAIKDAARDFHALTQNSWPR